MGALCIRSLDAGNPLECASSCSMSRNACAFMVTKLKHGCHARGMISNPYLFWSAKPTYFEMPTEGEPVIAIKHPFFGIQLVIVPGSLKEVSVHRFQ